MLAAAALSLWLRLPRETAVMMHDLFDKSVLIFGCGNILFGDDGFGPAVVKRLQEHYRLPPEVGVMDVGTSIRDILFNLALSEKRPRRLIIVDAVDESGKAPGEVFEISVDEIPPKKTADFSLHQFPTVNILKELKDHTNMDICILVAQVDFLPEEVQPGLSPRLDAVIDTMCERIIQSFES
jgi:coenzyme F420 hydrogenase subunit delta